VEYFASDRYLEDSDGQAYGDESFAYAMAMFTRRCILTTKPGMFQNVSAMCYRVSIGRVGVQMSGASLGEEFLSFASSSDEHQ
jgi:hypothetical protein